MINLLKGLLLCLVLNLTCLAQQWEQVPILTANQQSSGINPGGEGCQWPQGLAIDATGDFLMFGTDVGGIYRSDNSGEIWAHSNVGYTPRGNCGFAIDPNNSNRVLSIGSNSAIFNTWHGIYLSTDAAQTWEQVQPANNNGHRDIRDQVAFDPSSYDAGLGYSTVAYWSSASDASSKGLFRSDDGGNSWTLINASYTDCIVKVANNGTLYLGNTSELLKSNDLGLTFSSIYTGAISGLDVPLGSNNVYFISAAQIHSSIDEGATITSVAPIGLNNTDLKALKVNPVDETKMLLQTGDKWFWPNDARIFHSSNSGANWAQGAIDNSLSAVPFNNRNKIFAWHPTDPNTAWTFGGDYIVKTTDGGANWEWANNGYNAMFIGGSFAFSSTDPNVMYFGSQDYNGALTINDGDLWKYIDLSGQGWGGYVYGGYAVDQNVLFGGNSPSWGGTRTIRISYNGGTTYTDTGVTFGGLDFSYSDPTDPNILFASDKRSVDQGANWTTMVGCKAVVIHDINNTSFLYGINDNEIVKSTDKGATWTVLHTASTNLEDLSLDPINSKLYYVGSNDRLYVWDDINNTIADLTSSTPVDQFGARRFRTVAVDPIDPSIIYAGNAKHIYKAENSIIRSVDGGVNWEIISRNAITNNTQFGLDGGAEPSAMRVNPATRELWVATGTYGLWKIGAPEDCPGLNCLGIGIQINN